MEAQQHSVRVQELLAKVFHEKFTQVSHTLKQMMSQINGDIRITVENQQLDGLITYSINGTTVHVIGTGVNI